MGNTFVEIQRYRKWWMLLIVALLLILPFASVYQQIILGKPFGNNPASDGLLIVFAIAMVLLSTLFLSVYLKTEVGWDGISIRYAPFFKKQVLWNQVATAEIVDYGFVGGWGFRYSKKYGMVYNVKGRIGIAITLVNKQKFVIGTQKPEALKAVLRKYLPNLEPQWVTSDKK